MDKRIAEMIGPRQQDLRTVVATSAELGIPSAGFMSALAYFDSFRSRWTPANLIQAQRDYFGAHRYRRVDMPGVFHTEWGHAETAGKRD
jgi:6-phosphogluconate dehydrogenase